MRRIWKTIGISAAVLLVLLVVATMVELWREDGTWVRERVHISVKEAAYSIASLDAIVREADGVELPIVGANVEKTCAADGTPSGEIVLIYYRLLHDTRREGGDIELIEYTFDIAVGAMTARRTYRGSGKGIVCPDEPLTGELWKQPLDTLLSETDSVRFRLDEIRR